MTALPGLDLARLTDYLATATPGLVAGPLSAQVVAGGRSNLTYYLTDGTTKWVLRRPPLGHVLRTAHDMTREFRILSALAGTSVPVPTTVHLCADPEPLGAPFYLMAEVPGLVLRTKAQCEELGAEATTAVVHRLVDVLAELHTVDPASVGLGDFGRPDGYLNRQVSRWRKQLDSSRSREVEGIDELHEKLAATVPVSRRAGLLHGDYRLDNALVDPAKRDIAAVLDWEMSTLGDPLADVGLFVVYTSGRRGDDVITGDVTSAAGFPGTDDLIERYATRTGIDVSGLDWYIALNCFKLAVVLEGIHYRFTHGQTVGEGFDIIGERVPGLVREGLAALSEGENR
ncbi:MAG TPA: phosphotransferase family protein [Pseudonocardiaceae bacterium]|jgi:aminoglycoside phosphotransferase (APT) family kinase protein|nr:phosphotransferase family protein [Pseudonocardiaceae bacterium]